MKKYNIIYADPPWRYSDRTWQGASEYHYPSMKLEELCALPIKELAAKDCILFLWATYPKLQEAMQLISAWGFKYRSIGFQWIKKNKNGNGFFFGLGRWTRGNTEPCLIAVKGKPKRLANNISQLILEPIEYHSKKPDVVRDKIVELLGDIPRVELFARQKTEGWDVWGNEVECDIKI